MDTDINFIKEYLKQQPLERAIIPLEAPVKARGEVLGTNYKLDEQTFTELYAELRNGRLVLSFETKEQEQRTQDDIDGGSHYSGEYRYVPCRVLYYKVKTKSFEWYDNNLGQDIKDMAKNVFEKFFLYQKMLLRAPEKKEKKPKPNKI